MLSAYPWGALEPVTRAAERVASDVRRRVRMDARIAARALGELLEVSSELVVRRCSLGRAPAADAVWLGAPGLAIGLFVEPTLAGHLASKVLRRPEPLADPREPLTPALLGLVAALAVESARRTGALFAVIEPPLPAAQALLVEATWLIGGRPFAVSAAVVASHAAPPPAPELARLGGLALTLPLVIATFALERQELASLELFGALLPGAGATVGPDGVGHGMLVTPLSERGIGVEIRADGRLVVGEPAQARLSVERDETSSPDAEQTVTEVLLDTPIVVRVELGAVTMTAREWAALSPGDVIETAQRIAEPVLLRVAGREVGRGELVNVDGQVGVRIQKLYEGDS